MKTLIFFVLINSFAFFHCSTQKSIIPATPGTVAPAAPQLAKEVITGLENFLENYIHLVKDKRVGLVTNPSAINSIYQFSADLLFEHPQINLVALFGVEHGVRGDISAGYKIENYIDPKTAIPVYSLYGKIRKPTKEILQQIDVIIFDIQDVGVRTYTYISSMGNVMEAAAEHNVEMIILDRPNPLGGNLVDGNILKEEFKSYIGYYPIPYCHGMTVAEIAKMYNTESKIGAKLTVVPLKNWQREMIWQESSLPWVPTSPHVPHWQTTLFLPMTGTIGELQTVNIGVGYTSPFEFVGAPWIDADTLADSLNHLNLPGVHFRPVHYKPYYATFKGETCHGVQIYITNPKIFKPFTYGLHIMSMLIKLYPEQDIFKHENRINAFHRVMGGEEIFDGLTSGKSVEQIEQEWQPELNKFLKIRKKYLLY